MTDADAGAAGAVPVGEAPAAGTPPESFALESLHLRAITLWRLGWFLRAATLLVALGAAEALFRVPGPIVVAALALAAVLAVTAVVLPPAQHRAWGYRLGETDLFLRHGVFYRTTTIVPHARIQHVDTRHGPVDRRLGLADVVVYTAGTRGAIITIPALAAASAERLRDRLIALSGAGDAV